MKCFLAEFEVLYGLVCLTSLSDGLKDRRTIRRASSSKNPLDHCICSRSDLSLDIFLDFPGGLQVGKWFYSECQVIWCHSFHELSQKDWTLHNSALMICLPTRPNFLIVLWDVVLNWCENSCRKGMVSVRFLYFGCLWFRRFSLSAGNASVSLIDWLIWLRVARLDWSKVGWIDWLIVQLLGSLCPIVETVFFLFLSHDFMKMFIGMCLYSIVYVILILAAARLARLKRYLLGCYCRRVSSRLSGCSSPALVCSFENPYFFQRDSRRAAGLTTDHPLSWNFQIGCLNANNEVRKDALVRVRVIC